MKRNEQLLCEIRDEYGDVESCGFVSCTAEAVAWYRARGIFKLTRVKLTDFGYTYHRRPIQSTRQLLPS